jgi:hypothetical protein
LEVENLKHDIQLNGYSQDFINSVIRSKGGSHQKKKDKPLGTVHIPYVKSISEKFRRIGNQYNIRTIFRTKHTLRSLIVRTRPKSDPQQTANCVYSIPCEYGRNYTGETGRPLAVCIHEHRHNLKQSLLEKSTLAQQAYEEGHRVGWDQASVLEIESNSRYRKYKESAHMTCLINPISQSSLEMYPIWIPLINQEVNKSKWKSV